MEDKKITPLGGKIWFSVVFFGLVGQIAWMVENMSFATFTQDVFANSSRGDMSYIVTTLMVILSALTATITTIFAGALTDKAGKRKPFISIGYIIWGITIILFGFIPMKVEARSILVVAVLLVAFDCIMTFAGSTANDAAFNAWIIDNTDDTNRGRVNGILSALPVIAVVIVFALINTLFYDKTKDNNFLYFLVLGLIPIVAGLVALFILKDKEELTKTSVSFKEIFEGFKPSTIKENKLAYITLIANCIVGIAQQTFFSYLINFLILTLNLGDGYVIPMAAIIVGSAVFTGVFGFLTDKYGRRHFYFPFLIMLIIGLLSFYLIQYTMNDGNATTLSMIILYIGGIVMMGGLLSIIGALAANFQDNIPHELSGRFQGVRMCFTVLIPMIIGPIISLIIGLDAMGQNGDNFAPPFAIFIAAFIVAIIAIIPVFIVRKHTER